MNAVDKMKKKKEILDIVAKIGDNSLKQMEKGEGDMLKSMDYIMGGENLKDYIKSLERTIESFNKENLGEGQRYGLLSALAVGYHLAINKMKEVN